jgi:hypothetical protein
MNLADTRTLAWEIGYELYCERLAEAKLDAEQFSAMAASVRRLARIPTQVELAERRLSAASGS